MTVLSEGLQVDRRTRWYAKMIFPEIDTRRTTFKVSMTSTYRFVKVREFGCDSIPLTPPKIQTIDLRDFFLHIYRRGVYESRRVTIGYSPEIDLCAIRPQSSGDLFDIVPGRRSFPQPEIELCYITRSHCYHRVREDIICCWCGSPYVVRIQHGPYLL